MISIRTMSKIIKTVTASMLLLACLALSGCSGNVGVGLSVGIPIGHHGHISVGTGRNWY